MSPLSELQAWFLTAIMTPGGVQRGLELAHERHGLDEQDMLRAAPDSGSRLHIYADGYVMRLVECLRADYPVLCRVMGSDLFDFFAKAYVWRHPSRSPTLYDLGAGFADFLVQSQPPGLSPEAAERLRFPVELARLERAHGEASRAPGLEKMAPATIDSFTLLSGQDAQVRLAPCARLLALSFPAHRFWEQAIGLPEDEAPPATPALDATFLAVTRLHYRVVTYVLEPWQFHYLTAIAAGLPVQQCHQQAAQACALPAGRVLADALLWLPQAAAAGLLSVA